ncbi:hypothetical protein [Runella zeae]|uniref:hypothetical protein n=1 Tax=Runella zeae TaxID=94255 RepID=UPI0004081649|nr:hypothetical protein [Runella zeae]
MQKISKPLDYDLLQQYLLQVRFADGRLTDATLEDFLDDLLCQYHTFLFQEANFWQIFTQDAVRFVTAHREESRDDVMCYLKSMSFRLKNKSVVLKAKERELAP